MSTHKNARIAILGAGPTGLAAAHYLKQLGYRDVLVLEKLGRVGGLAKSITDGYRSFDLGANYFTPAYTETIKLAEAVGAESYEAVPFKILMERNGELDWLEVADYVMRDEQGGKIGFWRMREGAKKFLREWDKVAEYVGSPTYKTVHEESSLHMSFAEWLDSKQLGFMKRLFEFSLPMMGYGLLDEIAAPYALKYMEPKTFKVLTKRFFPLSGKLAGSTRRFTLGFQRMFEQLSWQLNVRTDVTVTKIERAEEGSRPVAISLHYPERLFNDFQKHEVTYHFDKLIVACPLLPEVLFEKGAGMSATATEKDLFKKVQTYHYCQTTMHVVESALDENGDEVPFKLQAPVVPVMPFSEETVNRPWALVQVWEDDSRMMQIYSRMEKQTLPQLFHAFEFAEEKDKEAWRDALVHLLFSPSSGPYDQAVPRSDALLELLETQFDWREEVAAKAREVREVMARRDADRDTIVEQAEALLARPPLNARVAGKASGDPKRARWRTFHEWPYFGHLPVEDFSEGFFKRLDDIQGDNHTYYAGGATTFELVESVVRSAKYAVERLHEDLEREAADGRLFPL